MRTVYADTLFLFNACADYVLLLCAGKLCGLPLRRVRLGLGALLGGAYALCAALWPRVFDHVPLRLLAGAGMAVIGFGFGRQTPRAVAAVLAAAAAFGGAVYALSSLSGSGGAGPSPRVLFAAFALSYALTALLFRCAARRGRGRTAEAVIELAGRAVRLTALEDTGNELSDPVSGDAVLIAEAATLAPLFPGETALTEPDAASALPRLASEHPGRFRLLPCATVAAERALLLCFRPDEVRIGGKKAAVLVGVSPHPLSADGRFSAIYHA